MDIRVGRGAVEERLSRYLSKLTFEAAGGRFKKGRKGGATPFELLDRAISDARDAGLTGPVKCSVAQPQAAAKASGDPGGLPWEAARWLEWEQASHGQRQLTWSRHLRALAGLDAEKTDEEVAAEETGGQTIAVLPARTWRRVYPHAVRLLAAVNDGGRAAGYAWLDARSLVYDVVDWAEGAVLSRPPPQAAA